MKISLALIIAACFWVAGQRANSQIVDWGSPMYSNLIDSKGQTLDQTFAFEIGAFLPSFTPTEANVAQWSSNWQTFDTATYNGIEIPTDDGIHGYFASTVQVLPGGHSLTNSSFDFQGRNAYLWIHNSTTPEPGTEWLLTRAQSWTFPTYDPNCCAPEDPNIAWSVSDLTGQPAPVWGSYSVADPGTVNVVHTLQTATFVPEPTTALLAALTGAVAVLRRRRHS